MSKNIGVVVTGVSGRMGQMIVSGILDNAQLELVGALEREGHNWVGQDVGLASGGKKLGIKVIFKKNICEICSNNSRDNSPLCVVETPSDIHVIEQSGVYRGKYFVLSGYLSPIDGIGASELGLDELEVLLKYQEVNELILATNATIEGEVTAHYIHNLAKKYQIKTTRIAHGIPLGGELEYTDINTIAHALSGRKDYNQ